MNSSSPITIALSRAFAAFPFADSLACTSCTGSAESPFPFPASGAALNEDEVLAFVHTEIGSVWAVELLIFLRSHPDEGRGIEDLVLALRSSSMAVAQAINRLHAAGFIREQSPGIFKFEPRSSAHLQIAEAIAKLSAQKPMKLAKAIVEIPNEKLRNFSDAFKFRE